MNISTRQPHFRNYGRKRVTASKLPIKLIDIPINNIHDKAAGSIRIVIVLNWVKKLLPNCKNTASTKNAINDPIKPCRIPSIKNGTLTNVLVAPIICKSWTRSFLA